MVAVTDPSSVDVAGEWLGLVAVAVGLLLGAIKLGAMMLARWRDDEAERQAVKRFGLYFPAEGDDSPLSVPRALTEGADHFRVLDEKLDEGVALLRRHVADDDRRFRELEEAGARRERKLDDLGRQVEAHSKKEEDLGDRLERLVDRLLEERSES